jgi:hypothetical protein
MTHPFYTPENPEAITEQQANAEYERAMNADVGLDFDSDTPTTRSGAACTGEVCEACQ